MVRFWPRHLFGDARKRSLSQVARDPTFLPIFEEPVIASTPMWRSSLRLANVPAFVDYDDDDEDDDRQPLWYRDAYHAPGCPCCIEGTGFPRPPSSALGSSDDGGRIRKVSRASTNISSVSADSEASSSAPPADKDSGPGGPGPCDATIGVRRSVSTFNLRMKKSVRSLRGRSSGNLQ
ncbi:hypothetical protein Daus18300_002975 [Diaporthe australafricana]|uniref:Uncharacterized protein n=1 Tax=Diaporthe australafricana TaxID=127596 RepID=A0ABR3XIN5_9PEZI